MASGFVDKGNVNLFNRPRVYNKDGSVSSVRSKSFNFEGKEVLLPTISDDGRNLTDRETVDLYRKTGKHLGIFDDVGSANSYADALHKQQEGLYGGNKEMATERPFRHLSQADLDDMIKAEMMKGAKQTSPAVGGLVSKSDYVGPDGRTGLRVTANPTDEANRMLGIEKRDIENQSKIRGEYNTALDAADKKFHESTAFNTKWGEQDKRTRDIQEIEAKLRKFQGPTGYNMPKGAEEIVPGTGIYRTGPASEGNLGSFSNRGVTERKRVLTKADQEEVQGLEERRREIEAAMQGKVYTPAKETARKFSPEQQTQIDFMKEEYKANLKTKSDIEASGFLDPEGQAKIAAINKRNAEIYRTIQGLGVAEDIPKPGTGGEQPTGMTEQQAVQEMITTFGFKDKASVQAAWNEAQKRGITTYSDFKKDVIGKQKGGLKVTPKVEPKQDRGRNITLYEATQSLGIDPKSADSMMNDINSGKINNEIDLEQSLKALGVIARTAKEFAQWIWADLDATGNLIGRIPIPGTRR